jgi:hypothetical protein
MERVVVHGRVHAEVIRGHDRAFAGNIDSDRDLDRSPVGDATPVVPTGVRWIVAASAFALPDVGTRVEAIDQK